MSQINLLPVGLAPGGLAVRVAKISKNLFYIGFAIFLAVVIVLAGVFTYYALAVRETNEKQKRLTASIKSLESTEARIVLVKDRLEKIKNIWSQDQVSPQLGEIREVVSGLTADSSLTQAEIVGKKNDLRFTTLSTRSVREIINKLRSLPFYERLALSSLNFDPTSGFSLSVSGSTK